MAHVTMILAVLTASPPVYQAARSTLKPWLHDHCFSRPLETAILVEFAHSRWRINILRHHVGLQKLVYQLRYQFRMNTFNDLDSTHRTFLDLQPLNTFSAHGVSTSEHQRPSVRLRHQQKAHPAFKVGVQALVLASHALTEWK
jgi:hypothetical protein